MAPLPRFPARAAARFAILLGSFFAAALPVRAQETLPPLTPPIPAADTVGQPLPINLPTALQLAGVRPIDVAIASERVRVAAAELDRAHLLWLPTLYLGGDYARVRTVDCKTSAAASSPRAKAR